MIKSFLILINLQILLFSSQQTILVVSDGFSNPKASLECYEGDKKIFQTIIVNIGKNGLGWGIGEVQFKQKQSDPLRREGDKKAPAGVFRLTDVYGYSKSSDFKMPYLFTSKNLICVDDGDSNFYNQIIEANGGEKSFERMKRDDGQYELGIVVKHNAEAIKGRGSCIFLHVEKTQDAPTAGCTSMPLKEMKKITSWLDEKKKPILIQIPKSSAKEVLNLYPELKSSSLLKEK